MGSIVFWVVVGVIAAYAIMVYNGLVSLKHNVSKAWANIDVLLKQRGEELPKLVETCKQYMAHEKDTLERVIKARSVIMLGFGLWSLARAEAVARRKGEGYGDARRGSRCRR